MKSVFASWQKRVTEYKTATLLMGSSKLEAHQICRSVEEYDGDSDEECNSENDSSSTQKRIVASRIKLVIKSGRLTHSGGA
jgi:hypothetical protein